MIGKIAAFIAIGMVLFIVIAIASGPAPISPEVNNADTRRQAAAIIKDRGFTCADATEVSPGLLRGLHVTCVGKGREYHYGLEDRGGIWAVEFRY